MKKLDYCEDKELYLILDFGHPSGFCATSKFTIPDILNIEYYKFIEIIKKYRGEFSFRDKCIFENKQDILNVIDELSAISIIAEFEK